LWYLAAQKGGGKGPSIPELIVSAGAGALAGAVLAALLTQWMTNRREDKHLALQRQGIARVLYQDFLRQQSALARALYRGEWWHTEELLKPQVSDDDTKVLATGLARKQWDAVARALGWMGYLRNVRGKGADVAAPNDYEKAQFGTVYTYLDIGRIALCDLGGIRYFQHQHDVMKQAVLASGRPVDATSATLESLEKQDAQRELDSLDDEG
jgi:hypothetical protein